LKLPELRIGHLVARLPIIQGGMAVRISTARLAGAVAAQGGIGLIAASGMTFNELRDEIRMARSGAGFSRDVFAIGKASGTPIVPVVSSVKAARLSESLGASAVVVEGKEAGGHLGTDQPMHALIPDILKAVKIPVIGAGGVIFGRDIVEALKLGCAGVQMGTRFMASEESNAAPALKEFYLKAKPEDVVIIQSPVGLPGQAIMNPYAAKIREGTVATPDSCDVCLKHCKQNFCIVKALIRAQQGDVETGLVFTGEYIHKIDEILSVKEIFARLLKEVEEINT